MRLELWPGSRRNSSNVDGQREPALGWLDRRHVDVIRAPQRVSRPEPERRTMEIAACQSGEREEIIGTPRGKLMFHQLSQRDQRVASPLDVNARMGRPSPNRENQSVTSRLGLEPRTLGQA